MISIRSCDSLSMISYGVMPGSRFGTLARSISMPLPPRLAVSHVEQVRPAAPMSNAGNGVVSDQFKAGFEQQFFLERIADLHRWTIFARLVGQFARSKRCARKTVATRLSADVENGIPTPSAVPRASCSWRNTPRQKTFTSGLPSKLSSK